MRNAQHTPPEQTEGASPRAYVNAGVGSFRRRGARRERLDNRPPLRPHSSSADAPPASHGGEGAAAEVRRASVARFGSQLGFGRELIELGAVPSGSNLTFESALDWSWPPPSESLVGNNGAIRTVKR